MFYILNFDDHSFVTCENADMAERQIMSMIAYGHGKDSLEVVNGFADGSRMGVDEFRAFCEENALLVEGQIPLEDKLNSRDGVVAFLMRNHCEKYDCGKQLLTNCLAFFESIFGVNYEEGSYSAGSLERLAVVLGRDFRNSHLLFEVAGVFANEYDPEYCVTYDTWEYAIRETVGEEVYERAFDEAEVDLALTVESWEDMKKKYPIDRDEMTEEEETSFVNDCFALYEKEGFSPRYWSPFSDNVERVGLEIAVTGRIEIGMVHDASGLAHDLSSLPMWKARFADGEEFEVFPEEIIPSQMKANGCHWFDETITYDAATAKNMDGLAVDVMSPQEVANTMGKAVKDGNRFFLPADGNARELAGRLVDFMKDYDFYHFMDSMGLGGEEEAVGETQKALASNRGVASYVEALTEIICEGELTADQETRARHLLVDLNALLGITEITVEQANQIYQYIYESEGLPHHLSESELDFLNDSGKYYLKDGNKFVGLDCSLDFDYYVEEFNSFEECVAWLNDAPEIGDIQAQNDLNEQDSSLAEKIRGACSKKSAGSPSFDPVDSKGEPER